MENIVKKTKEASLKLVNLPIEARNYALEMIANSLDLHQKQIFDANQKDLQEAQKLVESGEISQAVFDRLKLDENKMRDMIAGVRDVIKLDNPINKCLLARSLDEGLTLYKISCPIGVLGVIFEARPDVIVQISALAIKSSNAVILKGGKEAIKTNKAIFEVITDALDCIKDFPKNVINQVYSREDVAQMLEMEGYIDLIIPRGGNSLVKFVQENTKIPVLGHADGICHIFVDESADFEMAKNIVIDAKTQYPSACNSVETLLINNDFKYSDELLEALKNVEIKLIDNPESWAFEYGDKTLAYKFVSDVTEAIEHINKYGSGHTDCIISENFESVEKFLNEVDSAGVYHNVSTRFADGFRYGFGAEVGISTNKTHARGPVGLEGLTIYKYKLYGTGHVVKDYAQGLKQFHHSDL
ncbi:MAG TPA: glutamate-5-semialdehyde dehydrogenase [Candidatus Gastranaerophilaceae bacterium]|nr:glutamate-5-semialdehyde dehydrogenase [Candidatus Gastranaerophilaceae bacterium]HPT41863.1 glutamate-5-semialdehyde dehydrogenase [Candidatus Gastranaerophilaceae bacterium]